MFISGMVPRASDASDGTYAPADVAAETVLALANLAAVAEAGGGSLSDAVKITAYLADGADFAEFNKAYAEFFPVDPPARTTVVAGLREVKVEVDAIVYLGTSAI